MKRRILGWGMALATVLGCGRPTTPVLAQGCAGPTVAMTMCGGSMMAAQTNRAVTQDSPAVHGMLVVGTHDLYLSHLPMFHAPHDYQAIVACRWRATGGDPQQRYLADRAKTGATLYTLVPEPFVLPDVIQGQKSFRATLYRGHFERGGVPILTGLTVDITRVVHFRKFDPAATHAPQARYLVFGTPAEAYAAHLISAPPDVDQVLSVRVPATMPAAALAAGQAVDLPGQVDGVALTVGKAYPMAGSAPQGQLTGTQEWYRETGDLAD